MDTCKGDSGGALVRATDSGPPYTQFAIVSYGMWPCGSNHPGVYTSVVDYMEWIENNIKP
ncbi:UNVERIFIED_CONTAM: hypothetical protein GTU68_004911 [Idotea baltica]|nr:hypothetical protein [Idotea baltica]